MKYYNCPHCNKQLINQNNFFDCDNENKFWCDDCGKIYIIDVNSNREIENILEEESI